jgi:hypothetical protein
MYVRPAVCEERGRLHAGVPHPQTLAELFSFLGSCWLEGEEREERVPEGPLLRFVAGKWSAVVLSRMLYDGVAVKMGCVLESI